MNSLESIVFYFPYHGVGGVSVLFLRLAEYLKSDYSVYVADYSDGYMARNLPHGVKLIRIDSHDDFPGNSVFIFQSFLPWRFPYLSRVDMTSRIFFWNLHPKNWDPNIFNEDHDRAIFSMIAKAINRVASSRREKIRNIVNYLLDRDALAIMDRENARTMGEIIGSDFGSLEFLPVPTPRANLIKKAPVVGRRIRCAWVGRIADFKYRILEHLIHRLNKASNVVGPLGLIVIGEGEYASYIRRVASSQKCERFHVEFAGELPASTLSAYLVDNVDIVFSMGTSALEAAALGIPVFLTDYSYKQIVGTYRFSLLFDNSGYCLGEEITSRHFEQESSLEYSIQKVRQDYEFYSVGCYEYWQRHFSLEAVGPKFLERCRATRATFSEMAERGYFKSDWIGLVFRWIAWVLRGNSLNKAVGFRNDC